MVMKNPPQANKNGMEGEQKAGFSTEQANSNAGGRMTPCLVREPRLHRRGWKAPSPTCKGGVWYGVQMLLVFSLLSAAFAATVETPHKGGQLTLALTAEPKTFDPLKASDEPSGIVRYLTGGVLIRLNRQTQRLEPELALSWTNSENGKRISFRLRKGVQFSDGSPFRAADVCFTISRLMDPALDSPFSDNFEMSKGKTVCQAEGETTVSLTFPRFYRGGGTSL